MRISICDDNLRDITILKKYISQYFTECPQPCEIREFHSASSLLANLNHLTDSCDLLFLDIYFDDEKENGIDLAEKILKTSPDLPLIFISTSRDFALEAFNLLASGYLLKPLDYAQFSRTFHKVLSLADNQLQTIAVTVDHHPVEIRLSSIMYIESLARRTVFHIDRQGTPMALKTYMPLNELSVKLENHGFLRCRRTHIVNMSHIISETKEYFELKDHTRIPISLRSSTAIRQQYYEWLWTQAKE
ncbi:LytR/AlgR family response regulator transcription factor [Anaerostipes sp.]|uniref:LytR/AlgR family response regulator transcription factor n=1 Tax=Anaerostipes sp. TaxID=1872530 RepID=UPI0025C47A00|nr:LytTR family DNA-binding domain-containing protein [Anaerostipes sp.]MBS7007801.1 response regulator transcription factor [Anaerostipes sp.]